MGLLVAILLGLLKGLGLVLRVFSALFVLFVGLLVFIWLPQAARAEKRDAQRMRDAAERAHCLRCSERLGLAALEAADAAWEAHRTPWNWEGGIPRVAPRYLSALCPACGAAYGYDKVVQVLTPLPDGVWPPPPRDHQGPRYPTKV